MEDGWYSRKMREIPHARLPPFEVARNFSVEAVWTERPFGYHAPRMWYRHRLDEIWKYCPEVSIINQDNKTLPFNMKPDEAP